MPLAFPHPVAGERAAAVRRAWLGYLDETRHAPPEQYAEVEERAWRRLVGALVALGEPIDAIEPPGGR